MSVQIIGIIISAVLGLAATITSSLVLYNLRTMSDRIERLEADYKRLATHKEECLKDFVSIPQYIRNFTSLENSIGKLVESVSEMKGSLRVIEQMPQICGSIAREIVKEMKQ